ncbi:hypothetical protein SAMN04488132_11129 [Sediminibacterium ginsengisoli]|uniref:Uncharacterized protein n=1 Tax=Sediminibacterium ginsengisoli TaxID=413434 RepID=A0A1T4R8U3_9BACT|nr:hypothetical protein SAMN04488132_11129 [Sediminibacterium ginsengisoli]
MLTTIKQKTFSFFGLALIYTLIIGLSSWIFNNIQFQRTKSPYIKTDLIALLQVAFVISFMLCVIYYLLKFIPQVRKSLFLAGVCMLILSYVLFTAISMVGSLGVFNPLSGEYLLEFLARFTPTFFMAYVDRFLSNRLSIRDSSQLR